jgi:malic enzyme
MYIFPGLGLAASISGASKITDEMLYEAACAVPDSMTQEEIDAGRIFPAISRIRDVSLKVATAVIKEAYRSGLTTKISQKHMDYGIEKFVARKMYFPEYVPLIDPRKA